MRSSDFNNFFNPTHSHSRILSDKEILYALNTHNVRADSTHDYLEN